MAAPLHPLGIGPNTWQVNATTADLTRPAIPPRPVTFATDTKQLTIDLAKTACIVVDMQNDFCHPDGWLASIGVDVAPARQPIQPLQTLLPQLRSRQVPILWLNWGNRPDLLNISPALRHVYNPSGEGVGLADPLPSNGTPVLTQGSWAAAVVDELPVGRSAPQQWHTRVDPGQLGSGGGG